MSDSVVKEWKRANGVSETLAQTAERLSSAIRDRQHDVVISILDSLKESKTTCSDATYVMTSGHITLDKSKLNPVEYCAGLAGRQTAFNDGQRKEILEKMVAAGLDPFLMKIGRFAFSEDKRLLSRKGIQTSFLRTLAEGYGAQNGFEPLEIILTALVQRDGAQAVQETWTAHRIAVPNVYDDFQFQCLGEFISPEQRETFGAFYQELMPVPQTRTEALALSMGA